MPSDDIAKALKDARIAALFAASCVVLVALLLLIDGQRNRVMLGHVMDARRILDEFHGAVNQAVSDAAAEAGASPVVGGVVAGGGGAGGDGAGGVVADAAAGAGVAEAGGEAAVPVNGARSGRAGMAGGPRGDG